MSRLRVALLTEGTYPFVDGGVSTWCHALCQHLGEVEYSVYGVTGSTAAEVQFPATPNRVRVVQLPQWDTEDISEYVQPGVCGLALLRRKLVTRGSALDSFLEPFGRLLDLILSPDRTTRADLHTLLALHRFSQRYDYTTVFRTRETWELFRDRCVAFGRTDGAGRWRVEPSALDLAVGLRWLHNLLMPIALPPPDVDLVHSTIAGVVGLVGVIARAERGTPFLLTEHGVYLRERYISVAPQPLAWFLKALLIGAASVASRLCYLYADLVAPVCAYNMRWEQRLGVSAERVRVIHNGIDTDLFRPGPKPPETAARPTAIAAARVSAIKDIKTMIRATAIARRGLPDLLVRVYGSLTADPDYVEGCRRLIAQLGLEGHFELAGFHPRPAEVYLEGDLTVLSSITEGFPYTVLESMACGRPVVATDVGGVREALEGCGAVVPPRDPEALARGMVELLGDPRRRRELGRRAREQVLARFRIEQCTQTYLEEYRALARPAPGLAPAPRAGNCDAA